VDGYAGYHNIPDVMLCGCWAHLRRKFDEALKGLPPNKRESGSHARKALDRIKRLFAIERELKRCNPEERLEIRNQKSRPIVEEFRKWLEDLLLGVLPKSLFGMAVHYGLNQWEKLVRFLGRWTHRNRQ
jgi:transposase